MAAGARKGPAKKPRAARKRKRPPELPWGVCVWHPLDWDHRTVDEERCRAGVPKSGETGYHSWQCKRKARHEEYGYGWCAVHRPSAAAERRRRSWDLDALRRDVKFWLEQVGVAYDRAMRHGKGPKAAEKAAGVAWRRLDRARRKLREAEAGS